MNPHGLGHFFAHQKQIHGVGKPEQYDETGHEHHGQKPHLLIVGRRQITHEPKDDAVKPHILGDWNQKHNHRRAKGIDHHTG